MTPAKLMCAASLAFQFTPHLNTCCCTWEGEADSITDNVMSIEITLARICTLTHIPWGLKKRRGEVNLGCSYREYRDWIADEDVGAPTGILFSSSPVDELYTNSLSPGPSPTCGRGEKNAGLQPYRPACSMVAGMYKWLMYGNHRFGHVLADATVTAKTAIRIEYRLAAHH